MTSEITRHNIRLSGGTTLSCLVAGDTTNPAVLLLHGFPSSSRTFRDVIPTLADVAYVIAPDLPGFGDSDVLPHATFEAFGEAISELLARLGTGPRYVYLHDFGAPVGFHIAMKAPELVLGLVIQNANAHSTGFGPQWAETQAFWSQPTAANEKAATSHLTFEGTRDQYVAGVPPEIAGRVPEESWQEDWRVMSLPGRIEAQRALIADYGHYASRFTDVHAYLAKWQPPALLVWGRHDAFFDIAEVVSWMLDLPRMEAHVFDGGHLLLETHAAPTAALMAAFIQSTRQPSFVVRTISRAPSRPRAGVRRPRTRPSRRRRSP